MDHNSLTPQLDCPPATTPPTTILPDRASLRREFDAAVLEIDQSRPGSKLTTEFYSRIGDQVFEAGYSALADSFALFKNAAVFDHDRWAYSLLRRHIRQPRLHVVSAPVGSGKTSFSLAFIAAFVRWCLNQHR